MKKVRYSGKTKCWAGEFLVYREDGSVVTGREVFAGIVPQKAEDQEDQSVIEIYTPTENTEGAGI